MTVLAALLTLATVVSAPASPDHAWRVVRVGDMGAPRCKHATVLLEDGSILIAGGNTAIASSPDRTAEIFDPVSGAFAPTGSMIERRAKASALRLDDGRALIVGGFRTSYVIATATAEAWDPETRRFSLVGPMSVPRAAWPSLVRLPDGRAAVLGGRTEGVYATATASVDVFDAATDVFTPAPPLQLARSGHGTCMLTPTQVLLVGGAYRCPGHPWNDTRSMTAEILDLETGHSEVLVLPLVVGSEAFGQAPDGACAIVSHDSVLLIDDGGRSYEAVWRHPMLGAARLARLGTGHLLVAGPVSAILEPRVGGVVQQLPGLHVSHPEVTPMLDGRVLVTGGTDVSGVIPQRAAWIVERVAPAAQSDSAAASRREERESEP